MLSPSPVVLKSRLLTGIGVPHGFSTRAGGVSRGMFQSLNFGNPGDLSADQRDPAENIRANWSILLEHVGASERSIVEVHQVHGSDVRWVARGGPSHDTPDGRDTRADAIVTDDPRRVAAVRVADCVPVLLASTDGKIVASVHAGWRGVVGPLEPQPVPGRGIIDATVRTLGALGVPASSLVAAIGPCIGPAAFEVGPDVACAFAKVFGDWSMHVRPCPTRTTKYFVDLPGAIREQLLRLGLPDMSIESLGRCTVSEPELFFSHRRDAGRTGRMVGVIGPVV